MLMREIFIKRPILLIGSGFIPGLLTASIINARFFLLFFSFLVLGLIWVFKTINNPKIFLPVIFLVSFLLGACVYLNSLILSENHIKNFTYNKGRFVQIKGVVLTAPQIKKNKQSFVLSTKELITGQKAANVQGKVLVWCFKKNIKKFIEPGQELLLSGSLYRPFPFQITRGMNYRDFLARKKIYAMLNVSKQGEVVFLKTHKLSFISRAAFRVKIKMQEIIEGNLSVPAAGIMKAMILGERAQVSDWVNDVLQKTGTVHVLAVSGLHVGIISVIIILLLRLFMIPYRVQYILVIFLLIFYCFITEFRVSVIRATIMAVLFLGGKIINRDYDALNALCLACMFILGITPQDIFSLGFQLSFLSVMFILILTKDILSIFPQTWKNNFIINYFASGTSVSLAAWIGTLGIIIYNFGVFSPITIISNLFSVSLLFLIVANGLLLICAGLILPLLLKPLALNCEFLINLLYQSNAVLLKIPGASFSHLNVNFLFLVLYYLFCAGIINFIKNKKLEKNRKMSNIVHI